MNGRRSFLGAAAAAFAAGRFGFLREAPALGREGGVLSSLGSAKAWLNSEPLTEDRLKGKVVLVSFWTYSCINWLRTQPYLRAWADKYRDKGLVLVGVHSPEFGFEKDVTNVRWAAKALRVDYPIAVDSDHAIWDAFDNQYWPALYFVDHEGMIRDHHFGEGKYDRSERIIQKLLLAAGRQVGDELVSISGSGLEASADWSTLQSPESYLGSLRRDNPAKGKLNHWDLAGDWAVNSESVTLGKGGGTISYRFHARDLNLVMGPARPGSPVGFRVRLDGEAPGSARGLDIDSEGNGRIAEPRLYQLIRQPSPVRDRQFAIEFTDPGVVAYVFTFG